MYTQRRLTQLLYLFMLWQPVSVYRIIFRPLFFILKAYTIGKKNVRVTIKITVSQNYNTALTQYLVWDPMYIREVFLKTELLILRQCLHMS